jgi:hypothetical protein
VRRRRQRGAEVPAELATFDVERWTAAATTDPDPDGWDFRRPTELYEAALIAAGVDSEAVARLRADAVVIHIKARLGWKGP